jgi:hypothetical protein
MQRILGFKDSSPGNWRKIRTEDALTFADSVTWIFPMKHTLLSLFILASPMLNAGPLVYEGTDGAGKGKHVVLIASDHEYKSEEILPALARILGKHHGFKCTVLFGVDQKTGEIKPGNSFIPGTEALKTADLMVMFTRFQDLPAEQMQPIVDYLKCGGPVVGLRTATHGF